MSTQGGAERGGVAISRRFVVLSLLVLGCGASATATMEVGATTATGDCSQLHRVISRWQGAEVSVCGPDLAELLELTPLGNHQLLARRRLSAPDAVWSLTPEGIFARVPTPVAAVENASTAGFTLVPGTPGTPPRVLVYVPGSPDWNLYRFGPGGLVSPQLGSWPQGPLFSGGSGRPWGHQFIGLPEGVLLDRSLGDGSSRIWRLATSSATAETIGVELLADRAGAAREALRRGHRLVPLGPGRLLEWVPRACAPSDAGVGSGAACTGADFNVWGYSLSDAGGGGDLLSAQPVSSGFWPNVGAGDDILADETHLFVWTRAQGRLRSYPLIAGADDPLAMPMLDEIADHGLVSEDWHAPTAAPAIKHLVLILQDGRSFDSYFGQYCQGAGAAGGQPMTCEHGPTCCERMPASIRGALSCAPLDPVTDNHAPITTPDCLRAKIDDGAMDGFASSPSSASASASACSDPLDFACAGVDAAAGALSTYQRIARDGALADRFFQSYAFADGPDASVGTDPLVENLLYLIGARFTDQLALRNTRLLTKELARLDVPWAVYAGPITLARMSSSGVPVFHDPDWYPYRSLDGGELAHDLETGQLPSVAVVVPDGNDKLRSEAPGHPFDQAVKFVSDLGNAVASSPRYGSDTLVLLTYTTAGGYYDHVSPPVPPPLAIDATSAVALQGPVHYGPRVPLLAFPPFGRRNHISHVPLEMSSITAFIEWNWMHGISLADATSVADIRRYRDTTANNLGSLIDAVQAGAEVPVAR